jgi:hypothetical protein
VDTNNTRIQLKNAQLAQKLKERHDSVSEAAKVALYRYFHLLEDAVRRLGLTKQEASLIADALNGWWVNAEPPSLIRAGLYMTVLDAIELNQLDKKWGVNGSEILEKLKALSELEAIALVDAIQRFWYEPDSSDISDVSEKLKKVGLIS